ncbi:Orn/Lys/Arg family decarboxylase [Litoribacterium kuwaitense]|uniref:Orn/Lys/Arg family decarboxylase n=1 Tax=Litoribacterium kuwaitense TaxID=1398745 RepID=UPI001FEB7A13|nr:hypothetical protein [Litoribacterium kuwaitense]
MHSSAICFPYSYHDLKGIREVRVPFHEAEGRIAAGQVTPYPPGIPWLIRGEPIQKKHVESLQSLMDVDYPLQGDGLDMTQKLLVFDM